MKYADLQKIIDECERSDWLIHGNRTYVYKEDVLFTVELMEGDDCVAFSPGDLLPKVTAVFRYGGSLIEHWPLLRTYSRPYSELLPEPRFPFNKGESDEPFCPKRLDVVRRIFNRPDQHEAVNQAVAKILDALEQDRRGVDEVATTAA
jgi:hypothetical protein